MRIVRAGFDGGFDTLDLQPRNINDLEIAPDGSELLFRSLSGVRGTVYTYELSGGRIEEQRGQGEIVRGIWGRDGARLMYSEADADLMASSRLVVERRDGDREVFLSGSDRPLFMQPTDWSTGGSILFDVSEQGTREVQSDVYFFRPGVDTLPQPLAATEWEEGDARASPDGQLVAYRASTRDADGEQRHRIMVRTLPEGAVLGVVVDQANSFVGAPSWSPDGRTIYYREALGLGEARVVAADLDAEAFATGDLSVVGTREVVRRVGLREFVPDPDGTGVYLVEFVEDEPEASEEASFEAGENPVFVVVNWFTELRERLGLEDAG